MISIGLTADDVKRIAWTFVMAALGVLIASAQGWVNGGDSNWKAWVIAAIAAGVSAVKNGLLSDTSPIK